jgi:hypothetical protein
MGRDWNHVTWVTIWNGNDVINMRSDVIMAATSDGNALGQHVHVVIPQYYTTVGV